MVSISTYGGWAGIALVGAGYWYLQSRRTTTRQNRSAPQKQANKLGDARKGKSKKQRGEGVQSSGEQGTSSQEKGDKRKKKQQVAHSPVQDSTHIITTAAEDINEEEDVNNQEFARQFQNAKTGTISTSRPSVTSRPKSVKQSQAKNTSTSNDISVIETSSNDVSKASSSAGVDGDDDLSEANSPPFGATQMKALRSGDISDMLESPAAGPSILRITEPATPSQPKKERKPTQPSEVVETKKQRQNRKKVEAKKEAREEQEKERRVLLEKQRRTAREAEGRAAKDGSSFMAAKAPTTSVWNAPQTTENSQAPPAIKGVELLDTYEPVTNEITQSSSEKSGFGDKKAAEDWDRAIPSEEEQMRLLEEETAWNTVTSKKGKKKGGESEQAPVQKVTENDKPIVKPSKTVSTNGDSKNAGSVTIIGDPTIDMSSFSYQGGPVNAVLENGDGRDYGYTMADDEWEVA